MEQTIETIELTFSNGTEAKILKSDIKKVGNTKIKKQIDKICEELNELSNILYVKELKGFKINTNSIEIKFKL